MMREEIRLRPDLGIVFERKEALKHAVEPLAAPHKPRHRQLWMSMAAAAVVALAAVLVLRPDASDMPMELPLAKVDVPAVEPMPLVEEPSVEVAPVLPAPRKAEIAQQITKHVATPIEIEARELLASIAPSARPIAMASALPPLTLQMERNVSDPRPAEGLRGMALAALENERSHLQLFDDLGEQSIVAFNTLIANRKTMVTRTYDAEGRMTGRQVSSLGLTMHRDYESK